VGKDLDLNKEKKETKVRGIWGENQDWGTRSQEASGMFPRGLKLHFRGGSGGVKPSKLKNKKERGTKPERGALTNLEELLLPDAGTDLPRALWAIPRRNHRWRIPKREEPQKKRLRRGERCLKSRGFKSEGLPYQEKGSLTLVKGRKEKG